MNENMAKVVAAIRRGEYQQQAFNAPKQGDSYCFMGVICNEYQKATGDGRFYLGDQEKDTYGFDGMSRAMRWAGLTYKEEQDIIWLNDEDQISLKEIAARIENQSLTSPSRWTID